MADGGYRTPEGDLDPNKVAYDIERSGKAWAQLHHAATLLEKSEKAVLSQLTNAERKEDPSISRKEAEDIARGSDQYLDHIYAMVEARRKANIAKVEWMASQARFEAMRTAESTRRAEMNAYNRR